MTNMTYPDVAEVLRRLSEIYREDGALHIGTPYHMLVMVALSARTRDEQILRLAPQFFAQFPTVEDLARADLSSITSAIATIGMYRQKAMRLKEMAQKIVHDYNGKVPETMEDLVTLPGVGRKTASVLLSAAFNTPAIAVDTHVARVTTRLGWVKGGTPEEIERQLLVFVPEEWQGTVNRVFVPFGRTICLPRGPRCFLCPLRDICPFVGKSSDPPKNAAHISAQVEKMHAQLAELKERARRAIQS